MPKSVIGAQLVTTSGVMSVCRENRAFNTFVSESLGRFTRKDWGSLPEEDRLLNEAALGNDGDRLFAKYKHVEGDIYIITEADSSVTTILFADEY